MSGNVEPLNTFFPNSAVQPSNCVCGGSIDLYGTQAGTVRQTLPVVNGNDYAIEFDVSAPVDAAFNTKTSAFVCFAG